MSPAKRSLSILSGFIFLVISVSFFSARLEKRKLVSDHHAKIAPNTTSNEPLFYKSVGASNPLLNKPETSQRIGKYTINIRTLNSRAEAEILLEKLNQFGFFAYYTPVRQRDHVLYHVRIGIFSDEKEASGTIALLQKKASMQGSVTKLQ